ncbi:MAG: helix-turn-helix domain-containing protein [Actinomycetota bacterium]|nr:helix-turn-helix domain-containing protein [Actinomycetota bacterium]
MTSAEMLRAARTGAGLTQRRLAVLGGTSQPKVSDYEVGRPRSSGATGERRVTLR